MIPTNKYKKKLIEVAIPLEAINAASAREKSIRHGHPSTLHLWWARRPLAACRAVIFASLVDDPSSHPEQFPTPELQEAAEVRMAARLERSDEAVASRVVPVRQRINLRQRSAQAGVAAATGVVPAIEGLPLRDAVRTLHAAGFRVRVEGSGRVRATFPAAGATTGAGALVRIVAEGA